MSRPHLTLQELTSQVQRALSLDYPGQDNGQVREVPDARTIRYYTTLGLVDRPASLSGRTAWYTRRHLLQIVAIKRLQAQGLSLAQVQEKLLGLPDAALTRIARIPQAPNEDGAARLLEDAPAAPEEQAFGSGRAGGPFWQEAPASASLPPAAATSRQPPATSLPLVGVPVSEEVTLLLAASRPLEPADLEAVRASLSPLFEVLERRRLIPRRER